MVVNDSSRHEPSNTITIGNTRSATLLKSALLKNGINSFPSSFTFFICGCFSAHHNENILSCTTGEQIFYIPIFSG